MNLIDHISAGGGGGGGGGGCGSAGGPVKRNEWSRVR